MVEFRPQGDYEKWIKPQSHRGKTDSLVKLVELVYNPN